MFGELEFYINHIDFKTKEELARKLTALLNLSLPEAEKSSVQAAIAAASSLTQEEFFILKEMKENV